MPDVRRDNNGIAFIQLRFLISGDSVFDPALNHHQRFRAIRVVVTAVRVAWLQDAPANCHIGTVADSPIREPGEIAPVKFLPMRFSVWEDFNVGRHKNGFLKEGNEGNEAKKPEDLQSQQVLGITLAPRDSRRQRRPDRAILRPS